MIKYGIADYGLLTWYGGFFDNEDRLAIAQELGFDGLERIYPFSAEDTLAKAAQLKKLGMGFATVAHEKIELSIKWTAALGGEYVWGNVNSKEFSSYLRQLQEQAKVCQRYGIKTVVHNHLGSLVETQEQVETMLKECPDVYLLLDTGHLAVAGGDVKYIAETYYDRIAAYHLKGWQTSATPDAEAWYQRGHFCGLGQGDFFVDNEAVLKNAVRNGFDGWVFLEHDTHHRHPKLDLKESFDIMKRWESEV